MRACALQEVGRHDEALTLVSEIRTVASRPDEMLFVNLVEAIVGGCRGEHDIARAMLNEAIADPINKSSPLVGYAYRVYDIFESYFESLGRLRDSANWFDRFGFQKSRAYSELALAVLTARAGDLSGARTILESANHILYSEIRDQHMIFNNTAVVELLDDTPDFVKCRDLLAIALRHVKDDYSELVVLTNLGIALSGTGDIRSAVECVDRSLAILLQHDFADRDVYWPVCFNASRILVRAGQEERGAEMLRYPREHGSQIVVNAAYWAYRYQETSIIDSHYEFLASRPHHPLYLSHWTIEMEGLSLLK